jgi:hypothetical protein
MIIGQTLKVLHDMWIKEIIKPSYIISYLDKLDYTLGFITLNEINVISKDQKTQHSWKTTEKNNTRT